MKVESENLKVKIAVKSETEVPRGTISAHSCHCTSGGFDGIVSFVCAPYFSNLRDRYMASVENFCKLRDCYSHIHFEESHHLKLHINLACIFFANWDINISRMRHQLRCREFTEAILLAKLTS